MAQQLKNKLVKGPYKPIHRNCAIYFLLTVHDLKDFTEKIRISGLTYSIFSFHSPNFEGGSIC